MPADSPLFEFSLSGHILVSVVFSDLYVSDLKTNGVALQACSAWVASEMGARAAFLRRLSFRGTEAVPFH